MPLICFPLVFASESFKPMMALLCVGQMGVVHKGCKQKVAMEEYSKVSFSGGKSVVERLNNGFGGAS